MLGRAVPIVHKIGQESLKFIINIRYIWRLNWKVSLGISTLSHPLNQDTVATPRLKGPPYSEYFVKFVKEKTVDLKAIQIKVPIFPFCFLQHVVTECRPHHKVIKAICHCRRLQPCFIYRLPLSAKCPWSKRGYPRKYKFTGEQERICKDLLLLVVLYK